MTDKPIVIDRGKTGEVATRWINTAGIGERPRLVAVEWERRTRRGARERSEEGRKVGPRGLVAVETQGSLL